MDVEKLKHECKFCKKSFPCGRSLGGHIRTHLPKPGYELRDNPKKTWRAADHHDLLINNSSFSSSSTKIENSKTIKVNQIQGKRSNFTCSNSHSSLSEQEEIVAVCLIMLSQDVGSWRDDITSLVTPAKSSENISLSQGKSNKKVQGKFSVGADNGKRYENATKGYVQEVLKSKEIGVSANKFDSNDQNSKNLESKRRREKLQNKASVCSAGKIPKVKSEACGYVKDDAKIKKCEVLENGFVPNDQNKHSPEFKRKFGQITASGYVKKGANFEEYESSDDEIVLYDQKRNHHISKSSFCKRSKFECTTCNKVFHSYQALGGHRASHKRLVVGSGCSLPESKLEENDIASIDVPPSPDDRKHQQSKQEQEQEREQEIVREVRMGTSSSYKKVVQLQQHECPICFRVFPSGQALGGHKRSHLLVASTANITNTMPEKISNDQSSKFVEMVERSTNTETTDLLDLNFPPAPNQDETTTTTNKTSLVEFIKPYWCVESSHSKHEPLLGLISN